MKVNTEKIWTEKLDAKESQITTLNSAAMRIQKENSEFIFQILTAFFVISLISTIVATINHYIRSRFDQTETSKHQLETSQNYERTTNEVIRDLKEKMEKALEDLKHDKRNVKF